MATIIEQHDDDNMYEFICPICGTIFSAREREIDKYELDSTNSYYQIKYLVECPNCKKYVSFSDKNEYNKNKDNE